jgi:hypothetical protein
MEPQFRPFDGDWNKHCLPRNGTWHGKFARFGWFGMCCLGEYSTETAIYSHAFDAHGNTKLHVLFLMDARSNCHHQTWVAIWKDHGFGTHASHAKVKMFNVCFFSNITIPICWLVLQIYVRLFHVKYLLSLPKFQYFPSNMILAPCGETEIHWPPRSAVCCRCGGNVRPDIIPRHWNFHPGDAIYSHDILLEI